MGKKVTVTREDLARACEEADKDMHRIGISGTFFERMCKHLGLNDPAPPEGDERNGYKNRKDSPV